MSRIIITGGSGFVGTNLVAYCVSRGDEVLNIDIHEPRDNNYRGNWRCLDILDRSGLQEIIGNFRPQFVYHLGARTDLGGATDSDYEANTRGLHNLIDVLEPLSGLERVIFASSRLVCHIGYQPRDEFDYCPTTAYGQSKVAGEKIVRALCRGRYSWVIVRLTSIWGPWFMEPYRNFFDMVRRGLYLHPARRAIYKTYGYVGNTIFQLDRLMHADAATVHGGTLYLGDYTPLEVRTWAERIREAFCAPKVREMPLPVLRMFARCGDALSLLAGLKVPLTTFRLDNLLTEMVHDLNALERICGPLPYTCDEGVRLTAEWMKAQEKRASAW